MVSGANHNTNTVRQERKVRREKNCDFWSMVLPAGQHGREGRGERQSCQARDAEPTGARRELASDACHQRYSENNLHGHHPGAGLPSAGVFGGS